MNNIKLQILVINGKTYYTLQVSEKTKETTTEGKAVYRYATAYLSKLEYEAFKNLCNIEEKEKKIINKN